LPHGLILDASSTTFIGAGEGNRTLVISLEGIIGANWSRGRSDVTASSIARAQASRCCSGNLVHLYARRQLLANAVIAASRVSA